MSRFPTQLECSTAEVRPGEPVRCLLRIYNPADAIDEYAVVGLDRAAGWISTEPPSLTLLPEEDGELELIIEIPPGSEVPAGTHHIAVEIRSSLDDVAPQTEDLRIDVAEVTDARLDLRAPPETSATDDVTATIAVANTGNHSLRLQFDAVDHDHGLAVRVEPWELRLEPFSVRTLPLVVPFGNCREQGRHVHRLEVTATAEGGLTRTARQTITHHPRPPVLPVSWPPPVWRWLLGTARLFVTIPILTAAVTGGEFLVWRAVLEAVEWAVLLAVATSLVGAALVAYYPGALSMARATAARGAPVRDDVAAAAVRQLAGLLLLVPGFVTDLVGAVLLLPAIAPAARARVPGKPGRAVGHGTGRGERR
jgi:UPF0716 family protein affecting phage T7 exclusion